MSIKTLERKSTDRTKDMSTAVRSANRETKWIVEAAKASEKGAMLWGKAKNAGHAKEGRKK